MSVQTPPSGRDGRREMFDHPVRPVDLPTLHRQLLTAVRTLESIEPHLADVHSVAFERRVGDRPERQSKGPVKFYLTDVGERSAKVALAELEAACVEAVRAVVAVRNCFAVGPSADVRLRGTLLGDESGGGAAAELGQALKAQGRRRERGEFVPVAVEPQPSVPGFKRPKATAVAKQTGEAVAVVVERDRVEVLAELREESARRIRGEA